MLKGLLAVYDSRRAMGKRRWIIAGAVVALLVVLVAWRVREGSREADGSVSETQEGEPGLLARHARPPTPAPQTLPAGSISGAVLTMDGGPIAGARVCGFASSRELAGEDLRAIPCTTTGDAGRYRLAPLVPANYEVHASAPAYRPGRFRGDEASALVPVGVGEHVTGIDIALRAGGVTVRGRVADIGGGPIAGAHVDGRNDDNWFADKPTASAVSNDAGEFELWVAPGQVSVSARADGYSTTYERAVAPGQYLELLLLPASVLAGRVVEAGSDRPVPRALVKVSAPWGRDGRSGSAFTDEAGRFQLTGLPPGRYKPRAEALGAVGVVRESVRLGLGETVDDLLIEVHPAHVVRGRILVAGDPPSACEDGFVALEDEGQDRRLPGGSDPDGTVEWRAVLPGTYEVSVWCRNRLPRESYPPVVVADEDVVGLEWLVDPGGTVAGTVTLENGSPVAGARVSTRTASGDPRGQRTWGWDETDAAGAFAMGGLIDGTYPIEVESPEHPAPREKTMVELEDGGRVETTIVLPGGSAIIGEVVDPRGEPVAQASVIASAPRRDRRHRAAPTLDDGTFEIRGLAPGRYRVYATRGGTDWWPGERLRKPGEGGEDAGEVVTVKAGREARVRLVVESLTGVIEGQVVDGAGAPIIDAFVAAERESEAAGAASGSAARRTRWSGSRAPVLTDTDGRFRIDGLAEGSYTLRAYRRGGGEALAEGVATGTETTLTIAPAGSIAGEVDLSGGGAPEAFSIHIEDEATGFARDESFFRTQGQWIIRDLPAGTYWVSAHAAQGTDRAEVTLAEGHEVGGIAFTLAGKATVTGRAVAMDTGEPLPGFMVYVRAAHGAGGNTVAFGNRAGDKGFITDEQGRFEVTDAPSGKVYVQLYPMMNWEDADYLWARRVVTLEAADTTDLGDIEIPRRRVGKDEVVGELGYQIADLPPDTEPEDVTFTVASVRAGGPAASAGLKVGDVIVSVDGHDVTGANAWLYPSLTRVPPGTTLNLGLARGDRIALTAAQPL